MFTPMGFGLSHGQDAGARLAANSANAAARDVKNEADELRFEIERLLMITEALWSMVKDQHGYNDDQLIAKVAEIDMRDGKLDGRVTTKEGPLACPQCGRTLGKRRPACLYCGTAVARDPFAR